MPKDSPPNLIDQISDFFDIYSDAPDIFKKLGAYFIVSSLYGPKVFLIYVGEKFRPNMFLALVADSRDGRKSTTINRVMKIVRHIDHEIVTISDITPENLCMKIKDKDRAIFFSPEFGGKYKSIKQRGYFGDILYLFSMLYGGEPVYYDRQNKSAHIEEGFFLNTIVGIPTPISRFVKDTGDFHEGYFNRYLFMQLENDQYNDPRDPFDIQELYKESMEFRLLIDELKSRYDHFNDIGDVQLNLMPQVHKAILKYELKKRDEIFQIMENSRTPILDQSVYKKYYGELVKYLTKLAMIHRISRLPLPKSNSDPAYAIEKQDLESAFELFKYFNSSFINIINEVSSIRLKEEHQVKMDEVNTILGHIKASGEVGITRTELYNACRDWLDPIMLTRHLSTLIEREDVVQVKVAGKTKPTTFYKLKVFV